MQASSKSIYLNRKSFEIMMKVKNPSFVRDSISSFFIGRRGIVSVRPMLAFSDLSYRHCYRSISHVRTLVKSLDRENQGLNQSFHSSSDEDDFAELGSPVTNGRNDLLKIMTDNFESKKSKSHLLTLANSIFKGNPGLKQEHDDFTELGGPISNESSGFLKLLTEKTEHGKMTRRDRKVSSSKSMPAQVHGLKSVYLDLSKPRQDLPSRVTKGSVVSTNTNRENDIKCKRSSSITIQKVPSVLTVKDLKEAVSIFGNVLDASMRSVPNELDCCDLIFESVEASRKAVAAGKISIGCFCLQLQPLSVPMMVSIRISNIGMDTAGTTIHSVCTLYGSMEGLVKCEDGKVDAFFKVKNNMETLGLLNKLNHTIIDNCQWSAAVIPNKSSLEVLVDSKDGQDDRRKLMEQLNTRMADLKTHYETIKVCIEDLENLHVTLLELDG